MNKNKAKKILQKHLDSLDGITKSKLGSWREKVSLDLRKIFGAEGEEFGKNLEEAIIWDTDYLEENEDELHKRRISEAKKRLKGYLEYANEYPLEKKKIENSNQILQLVGNAYFWSVLVVLLPVSYGFGVAMTSLKQDKEKTDLQEGKQKLEKQLEKQKRFTDDLRKENIKLQEDKQKLERQLQAQKKASPH